jgi:hypothetical protein
MIFSCLLYLLSYLSCISWSRFAVIVPLLLGLLLLCPLPGVQAIPKVEYYGPVLTLHLKDSLLSQNMNHLLKEPNLPVPANAKSSIQPWIQDWASVRPALSWSARTTAPQPFQSVLPALQQIRADVNYRVSSEKEGRQPITTVQAMTRWGLPRDIVLHIQPSLQFKINHGVYPQPQSSSVWIQLRRGANYAWTKVSKLSSSTKGGVGVSGNTITAQASVAVPLPKNTRILQSLQVTPSYDGTTWSTTLTATSTGQSRATLDVPYNYNNPTRPSTLTIEHTLNERHKVAPQINLRTGHITYQWDVALSDQNESSLQTRVDPLRDISITWTDVAASGKGQWVTDIRLRKCAMCVRSPPLPIFKIS